MIMKTLFFGISIALLASLAQQAWAVDPVVCRSSAGTVKAIKLQDYHPITTRFQLDIPNLQPLMSTTVQVTGTGASCLIAHFSAHARITDNYIVFQVRVDGQPMEGHLSGLGFVGTPVVATLIEDSQEQLFDPVRMVAYNFFKAVKPGVHLVEVLVAAGSNIITNPSNLIPSVGSPVLTLEYQ
jgi:hypothetical protein